MGVTRIQFDISDDKVREIEALMEESGMSTKKQYVEYAFTLLGWALDQARRGRLIASVDEETERYRELSMPPLENLRSRKSIVERSSAKQELTA